MNFKWQSVASKTRIYAHPHNLVANKQENIFLKEKLQPFREIWVVSKDWIYKRDEKKNKLQLFHGLKLQNESKHLW